MVLKPWLQAWAAVAAVSCIGPLLAQGAPPPKIYSCIDSHGHHYKSDRLNPECLDKDQQELNPDGSPKQVVPRTRTADEQTAEDEQRNRLERERKAKLQQQRTDTNLLNRFPDKAAHDKARRTALEDQQASVNNLKQRKVLLEIDRKKLAEEAEFYVGKTLPARLKNAIDANDAALAAVDASIANQQQEIERINRLFDEELTHLRQLWARQAQPAAPSAQDKPTAPARPDRR